MRYITDRDFLPDVKDVSFDVYQLLYGVVYNGREDRIYDSIISLCRKHREPLLRKAKVNAWKTAVQETLSRLRAEEGKEYTEVYIPYLSLHCTIERLVNLYTFALNVLNEVYGVNMEDLKRRNDARASDVKGFYPIPNLADIMVGYAQKCRKDDSLGDAAAVAIEEEIARRGIDSRFSSFTEEDKYKKIFFNADSLPKITYEQQEEESPKKGKSEEYGIKSGFLYYALKHYLSAVKPQVSKKQLDNLTEQGAFRIAQGLFKPEEPFDTTNQASETFYQYIHYKRFNDISTDSKKRDYDTIVERIRKFKLAEPLKRKKGEKPS